MFFSASYPHTGFELVLNSDVSNLGETLIHFSKEYWGKRETFSSREHPIRKLPLP